MKVFNKVRGVVAAVGLMLTAIFIFGCGNVKSPAKMDQGLIREGWSTAAMVYYVNDTKSFDESHIKLLCTMVWVENDKLLTSYHCVKHLLEFAQKEENEREAAMEAANKECQNDDLMQALGIICDDEVVKHTMTMSEVNVHFYVWGEDMGLEKEPAGWHLGKVVKTEPAHDLALVEAMSNDITLPHRRVVKIAKRAPAVGEKVEVVGHPMGLGWTFVEGSVSGYQQKIGDDIKGPFMQIEAPIYGGNSGGGAFNKDGELIGIADFMLRVPGEGFYIHTDTIRDFLAPEKKAK